MSNYNFNEQQVYETLNKVVSILNGNSITYWFEGSIIPTSVNRSLYRKVNDLYILIGKAWETSKTRKFFIALFIYLSISLYFATIGIKEPFINATVLTIGFLLSTLSLPYIRRL